LPSRRAFLVTAAGAAAGVCLDAGRALALPVGRSLAFAHTHTGEFLSLVYADAAGYRADALAAIDHHLRDFRTQEVHPIDPALLDLLHALAGSLGTREPFHVISGYRSPRTNATLRARSEGVARHSLHMEGKAIDIRVPGVQLARVREAALDLRRGGVGFYPGPDFVHVDTGRVRTW
jgi:uncharacterized protein YcbK (DUF882 family)